MTKRTLIGIAVASTFGSLASAHAAPAYQASWVAAGDEQYPPMVMFDGRSADTLAAIPVPGNESIGSASKDAASVSPSELSRTTQSRMRRSTARPSNPEREWVATGEDRYPPMVMFDGPSTDTLASGTADTLANASPDVLERDSRHTSEKISSETSDRIGSTVATPVDSVGASLPTEPPTGPSRSTGTDMHSGKQDKSAEANPEGFDLAADAVYVYTEDYVVIWTPMTAAAWEAYVVNFETASEAQASPSEGSEVVTTYAILLPGDFSSAYEVTAMPELTSEDVPG